MFIICYLMAALTTDRGGLIWGSAAGYSAWESLGMALLAVGISADGDSGLCDPGHDPQHPRIACYPAQKTRARNQLSIQPK